MNRAIEGNIWKYYLLQIFLEALVIMPVIVPFYFSNGLSMMQIFLLQGSYSVLLLFLEVPTGYIADVLGRRRTIIMGTLSWFSGVVIYSLGTGFWHFLLAELVLGLGGALISGADVALLYDSLLQMKRTADFKKIQGRVDFLTNASGAVSGILGGFLATYSLRLPIYANAVLVLFALPFAFLLVEPARKAFKSHQGHLHSIKKIIFFTLHKNKKLRWLIFYTSAVFAGTLTAVWFFQPYFKYVGIPIAFFGFLWAANNLSTGLFSLAAHRVEHIVGRKATFVLPMITLTLGLLAMALISVPMGVVLILLVTFARGTLSPISQHYINELTTSDTRATVLSIKALPQRLLFVVASPFLGWLADVYTLQFALMASGITFLVLAAITLFFLHRSKAI